ncbi:MAG: AraC family transcriptional regulator [Spirochaetes bacterium]|nr:AraC family transcriptional regulator [Spirochaetota bacterium]
MEQIAGVLTHIIYFGAGLTFMMAVEQLASRDRNRINYISAAMLASNSIITLGAGMYANGVQYEYPLSTLLFVTSVYLTGPLNLFYYTALMDPQKDIPARIKGHLVFPLAAFVAEMIFHFRPDEEKRQIILEIFTPGSLHIIKLGICLGALFVTAYLAYLTRETVSVWKSRKIRTETRIVVGLSVAAIAAVIFFLAGFLAGTRHLFLLSGLLLTGIHAFIFLAHSRYPEFFQLLKREIRETKYRNSMLRGMDTDALHGQLSALMTDENLYRDYDLSLNALAARLGITPHQLSQFLNERLRMNFSNYVNSFRIAEAKKLIGEDPARSVISICFHVGFNSKSAFNKAFRKFTGVNPKEIRRTSGSVL